jgi:hypothetical protein
MIIRIALLALAAVAASAVDAEELHVTLSGEACTPFGECDSNFQPFAISYMFNTNAAQLSQIEFEPNGGQNVLFGFVANFPVVNYRQTFSGQTTGSPHGMGHFNFDFTGDGYQWFGSANTDSGGFSVEGPAMPVITQAQYMAFKDPLADMLLFYSPLRVGMFPIANVGNSQWFLIDSTLAVKSTPVPTPEPMLLFATGLLLAVIARAPVALRRRVGLVSKRFSTFTSETA